MPNSILQGLLGSAGSAAVGVNGGFESSAATFAQRDPTTATQNPAPRIWRDSDRDTTGRLPFPRGYPNLGDLYISSINEYYVWIQRNYPRYVAESPNWHSIPSAEGRLRQNAIESRQGQIQPTPAPVEEPSESDAEIMSTIDEAKITTVNSQLIGCDPEFLVLDSAKGIVHLEKYFEPEGPVGWDHNGRVAELRPLPSRSTQVIVNRIQSLLSRSERLRRIKDFSWRAGAYAASQPIGGHVHLPIVGNMEQQVDALASSTARLIDLDILPLEENRLRQGTGYGMIRDIRTPSGRFEYRAMPSWLFHPRVAMLSMTLAKLAALYPKEVLTTLERNRGYKDIIRIFWNFRKKDDDARFVDERITTGKIYFNPDRDFRESWQESK